MTEEQWEYCLLTMSDMLRHNKGVLGLGETKGRGYGCTLKYFDPTGKAKLKILGTIDEVRQDNPFDLALALLGTSGWELVSVQHGIEIRDDRPGANYGKIRSDSIVAYFKRRVIPGRAIDEPQNPTLKSVWEKSE